MKIIILAGGFGSRLAEETVTRPKPMVEIGGKPMLWHIMKIYAHFGYTSFMVACGYKGEMIKEYFSNFFIRTSDWVVDLRTGEKTVLRAGLENWRVGVTDTGLTTGTGGRVFRLKEWVGNETFMVTYGDGVANIDISALVKFHLKHGKSATVTAVRPPARFGELALDKNRVSSFKEKPQVGSGWINGGFFVFEPGVFDFLDEDCVLERTPLERLAESGQLMAFKHPGFWQPMDTVRDRKLLETLWADKKAPWKLWP